MTLETQHERLKKLCLKELGLSACQCCGEPYLPEDLSAAGYLDRVCGERECRTEAYRRAAVADEQDDAARQARAEGFAV